MGIIFNSLKRLGSSTLDVVSIPFMLWPIGEAMGFVDAINGEPYKSAVYSNFENKYDGESHIGHFSRRKLVVPAYFVGYKVGKFSGRAYEVLKSI